jgi:PDZ domain-containing protein
VTDEEFFGARPTVRRSITVGWLLLIGSIVGAVMLASSPSPYVVERPGPAFDTLGQVEVAGEIVPLIDIPDETVYATEGTLDLLTVYIDGSPQQPIAWVDVVVAWFDPSKTVVPVELVYPDDQTDEEADEASAIAMANSQRYAIAAALTEVGLEYTSRVQIAAVAEGFPADGVLEVDDLVLAVGGQEVSDVEELRARLGESGPGVAVDLLVRRGDADLTLTLTPVASEEDGFPVIGVGANSLFEFPIDVRIQLERVGGPSAGMMFALGIYDKLTPGALTGGEQVAGTGTISPDGEVGAIGGIVQKMYGARAAGADWFLAPTANCAEVVGRTPGDLIVFSVVDLDDAIAVLEGIAAGDTAGLATCES